MASYREMIADGSLPPGASLGSISDTARMWGVTRVTVRRAVAALQEAGLVTDGSPPRVMALDRRVIHVTRSADHLRPGEGATAGADSWAWDAAAAGLDPEQEVEVVTEAAPVPVAARLGVEPGTRLVARRNRRAVDGRLDSLVTYWFPGDLADGTPLADPGRFVEGSLVWAERRWGPLGHRAQVEARPPGAAEAGLGVAKGWPVIVVWRRSWAGQRVVCVSRAVYPADRAVLELDLATPGMGCDK